MIAYSKAGVPEGRDGKTTLQVDADLRPNTLFFWRARALQDGTTGPWSETSRFRSKVPPANYPPTVMGIVASADHVEVDSTVQLTATVTDDNTPVDQLVYQWTALQGTFSGAGRQVTWRAPVPDRTPVAYDLTLTVIERYTVYPPTGGTRTEENRVQALVTVHVNSSFREISDLSLTFLNDFADSSLSPEVVVRNFSDSCRGKLEELEDVRFNRQWCVILSSNVRVATVTIDYPRGWADIDAPCEFTDRIISTGRVERASGTCALTATYENWRWWLCDSRFHGQVNITLFPPGHRHSLPYSLP